MTNINVSIYLQWRFTVSPRVDELQFLTPNNQLKDKILDGESKPKVAFAALLCPSLARLGN